MVGPVNVLKVEPKSCDGLHWWNHKMQLNQTSAMKIAKEYQEANKITSTGKGLQTIHHPQGHKKE